MNVTHATLRIMILVLSAAACIGSAQQRRGGWGREDLAAGLNNPPQAADAAEQRILDTAAGVERRMSVPLQDGRLIRILTEAINAKHAVEVGTSTGYSGLWFALALRKTGGRLTTFEYESPVAETARRNFRQAGVEDLITVIEGDAHQTIGKLKGPIDIAFIDADKEGYRDYLEKLLPLIRPGGLILAHNISSRESNPRYVDAVTTNPALDTLLFNREMIVTMKKR